MTDVKQRLKDRLREHIRRPMMPPGSEDLASAALAEIERLETLVAQGRAVVKDFLPNVGQCALQDYKGLNDFMVSSARPGEDS